MIRPRNVRWFLVLSLLSATVWLRGTSLVMAQAPGEAAGGSSPAAAPAFDAADNAWVLVSAALVLFMTAPALALFYGGLVRKRNVLSVLMQCVCLMCLMTVVWAVYGYSLVFGGDGPWIGDGRYLLMNGVNAVWSGRGAELPLYPQLTHSRDDAHAVSGHVLHHYAGPDLRGLRRTDEVQCHDGVPGPLGHGGLLPAGALDLGRRHTPIRQPQCPLLGWRRAGLCRRNGGPYQFRACRPWFARWCWASAWVTAASRCRRTT